MRYTYFIFINEGRNEKLGQEAVKKLNEEGLHPKFHQLDICDKASIERFKNNMQTTYGGIDILVNNAGIAYKVNKSKLQHSFLETGIETI